MIKHIRDYVESELDMFRTECNFTDEELEYFNLKAKNLSNVQISLEMNVSPSQISKLSKRVRNKISRVSAN